MDKDDAGTLRHDAGALSEPGTATMAFETDRDALVVLDGGQPMRAWHDGRPLDIAAAPGKQGLELRLEPGIHTVAVKRPVAGYAELAMAVVVADSPEAAQRMIDEAAAAKQAASAPEGGEGDGGEGDGAAEAAAPPVHEILLTGQRGTAVTDLYMFWGAGSPELGRVFVWLYDHVFFPCNATMFSLLAFFIASAAFRAFRARNTEAALLLGAAIFVMLGLVPIGGAISPVFPAIQEWIMDVLNTTGRRAIMMGAALGAIATSLRVILGIERSHLGSD